MRLILILFLTIVGVLASFKDAFYGVLLYVFWALVSPADLVYWTSAFSGLYISFIVAAVTIFTAFAQGQKVFVMNRTATFALFFLGTCYASLFVQPEHSPAALNLLWQMTRIMIMTFVIAGLLSDLPKLKTYCIAITVFTAVLGAGYGFRSLAAGVSIKGYGAKFGDNNVYAAWLVASLPLIAFVAASIRHRICKVAAQCTFIGTVIAVLLTFSRGGYIALVVTLSAIAMTLRKNVILVLGVIVAVGGFFYLSLQESSYMPTVGMPEARDEGASPFEKLGGEYSKRLATIKTYSEERSASGRLHFWKIAIIMANSNPVLGVGFMRYSDRYDEYDDSDGVFGSHRAVHSTILEVLADTGYIGCVLYGAMVLSALGGVTRFIRWAQKENVPQASMFMKYGRMIQISFAGYFIASAFVTTLFSDIFWCVMSAAVAMGIIASEPYRETLPATTMEKFIWEKL